VDIDYPQYWEQVDQMKGQIYLKIFDLNPASQEFINIQNAFKGSVPAAQIAKI
jgi:hypothetical protein